MDQEHLISLNQANTLVDKPSEQSFTFLAQRFLQIRPSSPLELMKIYMNVFDNFLSFFSVEQKVSDDKIRGDLLLLLSLHSEINMLNIDLYSQIRPILLRLFLNK